MNKQYPFENPPLPFSYDAMEPYIDTLTMRVHHDRQLQGYIDNLNRILRDYPQFQSLSAEELLLSVDSLPDNIQNSVRNNAGGIYNHIFFFDNMKNPAKTTPPNPLHSAILDIYGRFSLFIEEFIFAAHSITGSGYVWLVVDAFGIPKIMTTTNQNTPLPLNMYPLLNIDVWEHAYYLKCYNELNHYIQDWFQIVDWDLVNDKYRSCIVNSSIRQS